MTEQAREIYELEAPYKLTIPIEKAFVGDDGRRRLVGAATGPEIDLQGDRIHPSLIDKWISFVNDNPETVPYRDWHKDNTSTAELGVLEKAWKNEAGHMMIQVVLDDDNPVADFIHKKALKGKQFGMSVKGNVIRYAQEFVPDLSRKVRTFYDATLDEVSNTTRPVWTHSLGTVFAKAVDEELSHAADGDKSVANETETPGGNEVEVVETTQSVAKVETTESGAATAPDTQAAPDEPTAKEAEAQEVVEETAVVEKAISGETKKDAKRLDKIVKLYTALGTELRESGLLDASEAEVETAAAETTVEKSETGEDDRYVRLEKSIETLSATVLAIAENTPAGTAPGVLRKSEEVDPLDELRSVEDPIERLRLAMAARHGEHGSLR